MVIVPAFILWFGQMKGITANDEDYCRYKVHINPLNWEDANRVCMLMNRTLAKVSKKNDLDSLMKSVTKHVFSRVLEYTEYMSELWVGIRAAEVDGRVKHYWENCSIVGDNGIANNVWHNGYESSVGCVAVKENNKKYIVEDCSKSLPYICETEHTVSCFDKVDLNTVETELISSFFGGINVNAGNIADCKSTCRTYDHCIGFQLRGTNCKVLEFKKTNSMFADLNMRTSAYTMGNIGLENYAHMLTSVESTSKMCFQTIDATFPEEITSSSIPRATELPPEMTTSEILFSTNDGIESSFQSDPFDTVDFTASTSTPQLVSFSDDIQTYPLSKDSSVAMQQYSTDESQTSARSSLPTTTGKELTENKATEQPSLPDVDCSSEQSETLMTSREASLVGNTVAVEPLSSNLHKTFDFPTEQNTRGEILTGNIGGMSSLFPDLNSKNSTLNNTECMCPCSMYKNISYSPEELESRLKEIKEKLTINRKQTSKHQRMLISVPDDRISARRIGYAGVVVLAIISALIVLMDVSRGITVLRDFINNCR